MAIVVSIINLKGGVGKSTLSMMLAEYLAFRNYKKVLLVDMDAQANLSYIMVPQRSIQSQIVNHRTIYDFFESALHGKTRPLTDFITTPPLVVSNINRQFKVELGRSEQTLDMVISTPMVAQLDNEVLDLWEAGEPMPKGLRFSLKEGLAPALEKYQVILIDCPPGLSFFSSTALIASDFFISPIIPEPLSLEGVRLVQDAARELSRKGNTKVEFKGIILNIVKSYRNTHKEWADKIYTQRSVELSPFTFWLPDNERVRALGEFEIDEDRIKTGWAGGVDKKFYTYQSKYAVSWRLTNPSVGSLSQVKTSEGADYRIDERIERIVDEFAGRVGLSL